MKKLLRKLFPYSRTDSSGGMDPRNAYRRPAESIHKGFELHIELRQSPEIVGKGVEEKSLEYVGSRVRRAGSPGAEAGYAELVPQDREYRAVGKLEKLLQTFGTRLEFGQIPVVY